MRQGYYYSNTIKQVQKIRDWGGKVDSVNKLFEKATVSNLDSRNKVKKRAGLLRKIEQSFDQGKCGAHRRAAGV